MIYCKKTLRDVHKFLKIQIFYQIYMNFQHFGMKFAYKGVAVLIFEA